VEKNSKMVFAMDIVKLVLIRQLLPKSLNRPYRHILLVLMTIVLGLSSSFVQAGFQDRTFLLAPGFNDGKAAWGDVNNDGYPDLINHDSGYMWINNGGTGFSTLSSGGPGGVFGDYNNDGLLDIYYYGLNLLSRNQSTPPTVTSFHNYEYIMPSVPMWDAGINQSHAACWADFNNDGYADVYVTGYEIWGEVTAYYDAVLWNNQANSFTTSPSDYYNLNQTRSATACDWDQDGDQDVYASNYRLVANQLLRNNGSGSFTNVAGTHNATGGSGHSIGSAWGDIDNDGYFDLFAGNFAHSGQPQSRFLRNKGSGFDYAFEDKGTCGVAYQESYGTPALGDYDNDGDLDLFFTTVYSGDNPVLYRNNGNWSFEDVTVAEGLSGLSNTYQAAWADIDDDGDLDLVTDGKIFVNDGNSNHWLKVHLIGVGSTINGAAIGAQVRIHLGEKTLTRQVEAGTGEGNQNDLTLHFGLGNYFGQVDLEITAPDGTTRTVTGISVDRQVGYTLLMIGSLLVIDPVLPTFCGDVGTAYKLTDLNEDCEVNLVDLAFFAGEWLSCTHPANSACD
jgi:enediyne biosynthesis protein E4